MPLIYANYGISAPYERVTSIQETSFRKILSHEEEPFTAIPEESQAQSGEKHENPQHSRKSQLRGYSEILNANTHERKPVLRAKDIMTKSVHFLKESDALANAHDQMQKMKTRHIPIVNPDLTLVGMLSDRDILLAGSHLNTLISATMTRKVMTATPDTPIQEIAEAMLNHRIHALPITDSNLKLIGILTTTDILRAIVKRAPVELWT